jgi:hypothetical protein
MSFEIKQDRLSLFSGAFQTLFVIEISIQPRGISRIPACFGTSHCSLFSTAVPGPEMICYPTSHGGYSAQFPMKVGMMKEPLTGNRKGRGPDK